MVRAVEGHVAVGYNVDDFRVLAGVTNMHGSYRIAFAFTFVKDSQRLRMAHGSCGFTKGVNLPKENCF